MIKKLLYLSNLAFLTLYLILAWHNRLASDDFHYIINLHQYGILKGTVIEYNGYNSRWLSVLAVHMVLSLMPYTNSLFLLSLITFIAITFSFTYLLKTVFQQFLSYRPSIFLLINLGLFSVNAFFYSAMDIARIWFWLSTLPTYLSSFTCLILGCGIFLSSKKFNKLKLGILSLSFFYIGGSAEAFAAVVLLALFSVLIWLHFFNHSIPDKKTYLVRLCIAFFFCMSSLIVLYLGHGNVVRRGVIGEISISKAFILNIETTGWIGIHWILCIVPVILLFSLPLLYAGKFLSWRNPALLKNPSKLGITLMKALILYGVLIFIINYPITYLLCGIAPGRALAPVSFLTWLLFAFTFFCIGYRTSIKKQMVEKLVALVLGICISFNISNSVHQFIITRQYDMKYDALMQELTRKKDNCSVIAVSPLPPSGMLTPLDISPDSLTNTNIFIKNALGLKPYITVVK